MAMNESINELRASLARQWLKARTRAEMAMLAHRLAQERLREARLALARFAAGQQISIIVDDTEVRVLEDGTVLLPEVFARDRAKPLAK